MKAFREFGRKKTSPDRLSGSEYFRVSIRRRLGRAGGLWLAGSLTAAAFPPFNQTLLLLAGLVPLLLAARQLNWWRGALAGWLWGMGFAFWSFLWLREISWVIPWLMMPVLGAYYALFGWAAGVWSRWFLLPEAVRVRGFSAAGEFREFPVWRQFCWCAGLGACWVTVEYLRSTVLPWNYLGIGFHRNPAMIQIVRYTGVYGLSFLAVFFNAALALAVLTVARKDSVSGRLRYRRPWLLLAALGLLALNLALGVIEFRRSAAAYAEAGLALRVTLVQGNLSQRRCGSEEMAREALETYVRLTRERRDDRPDLVVWPETAVSYPLRSSAPVSAQYRREVRELADAFGAPLLLGTLEFDPSTMPPGTLNSAVLVDGRDMVRYGYLAQYDKVHPVPFGEFVPMRRYLPRWAVDLIDMKRDLTPGKSLNPLPVNNRVRLGVNICFEDVFPYIAREEYLRGANLLAVITNDAWYPTSSEPEQHLAHALFRAVETGLPMVRCGNDSATCVIAPTGRIVWSLSEDKRFGDGQPFRRGAGSATVEIAVPEVGRRQMTFYTRYGDWFARGCVGTTLLLSMVCLGRLLLWRRQTRLQRG